MSDKLVAKNRFFCVFTFVLMDFRIHTSKNALLNLKISFSDSSNYYYQMY